MSKAIPLSRGMIALVDDDDYQWLSAWKWSFEGRYAARYEGSSRGGGRRKIYMHHAIAGSSSIDIDHINGNKLDNQRTNLRVTTRSVNLANKDVRAAKSGFRGVTIRQDGYIYARISKTYLGYFPTPEAAARAYNAAALELYGPHARLNLIPEEV